MNITPQDVDAAALEYETDTSDEAQNFSWDLYRVLRRSAVFLEVLKRCEKAGAHGVALHAGVEIGLKIAAKVAQRKRAKEAAKRQ